ncbi:MAG: hypothetical protein K9N55_00510 [Phycisphaerae bacterium]|nr:hypothetical protein [Phycisphaerae bacterium]
MIINSKIFSIQLAVAAFFGVACAGSLCRLSPLTCCKRALICAFILYVLSRCAVKMVNKIIMSALVKSQMNQEEEQNRGSHE